MKKKRYRDKERGIINITFPPIAWWFEVERRRTDIVVTVYYRTPTNICPVGLVRHRYTKSDVLDILPKEIDGSFMLVATLKEVARLRDERRHKVDESLLALRSRREEDVVRCLSSPENRALIKAAARLQCCINVLKEAKSWHGARQLLETSKAQSLNSG